MKQKRLIELVPGEIVVFDNVPDQVFFSLLCLSFPDFSDPNYPEVTFLRSDGLVIGIKTLGGFRGMLWDVLCCDTQDLLVIK